MNYKIPQLPTLNCMLQYLSTRKVTFLFVQSIARLAIRVKSCAVLILSLGHRAMIYDTPSQKAFSLIYEWL